MGGAGNSSRWARSPCSSTFTFPPPCPKQLLSGLIRCPNTSKCNNWWMHSQKKLHSFLTKLPTQTILLIQTNASNLKNIYLPPWPWSELLIHSNCEIRYRIGTKWNHTGLQEQGCTVMSDKLSWFQQCLIFHTNPWALLLGTERRLCSPVCRLEPICLIPVLSYR